MNTENMRTETDALQEIINWSSDRPAWQQVAIRRLIDKGHLTEADINDLTDICKDRSETANMPNDEQTLSSNAGTRKVTLQSISNVENVNALVRNQTLSFSSKGITIVYGENGAGKSGYVRILKSCCRARFPKGRPIRLLPNIHDEHQGSPCAEIKYSAGAKARVKKWNKDSDRDDLLHEISVFDAETASVHVDEANEVAYTPFPMKILEILADACVQVKKNIEAEIQSLLEQTPTSISDPCWCPQTAVGHLMVTLGKDTKTEDVEILASLSDVEVNRLNKLTSDTTRPPSELAREIHKHMTRLKTIRTNLSDLYDAISDERTQQLSELSSDLIAKKEAVRIASEKQFSEMPLHGVGSETWRVLWNSAREYSNTEAYPEKSFPATHQNERCVLCHQELGEQAKERFLSFEEFVQGRTHQLALNAEQELANFVMDMRKAWIPHSVRSDDKYFLKEVLCDNNLYLLYSDFTTRALWKLRFLLRTQTNASLEIPLLPISEIDLMLASLEDDAKSLQSDERSAEHSANASELQELRDRQWLSAAKTDVLSHINRKTQIDSLTESLSTTKTNAITTMSTHLSKLLVTKKLQRRFSQEIVALEVKNLTVDLIQDVSKIGTTKFKIKLSGESAHAQNTGAVLSEGEHRCVALAGFLAELATNMSDSAIILDDPVSSLDHLHREAIANRLVQEGLRRQVIVFTHDLAFLNLIRSCCTQEPDSNSHTPFSGRHIQRLSSGPGHCHSAFPEQAQKVRDRLDGLSKNLSDKSYHYNTNPDGDEWKIASRGIIDSLRQIWESTVEELISPVLRPFSSKIHVTRLSELPVITPQLANTARHHYGECSRILHHSPSAMIRTALHPDKIKFEIDALSTWITDVKPQ